MHNTEFHACLYVCWTTSGTYNFVVLHETTHHAKFLRNELKVGLLSSHSYNHSHVLRHHDIWIKVLHTPVHSYVCSILQLQHEICIPQATNTVKAWE